MMFRRTTGVVAVCGAASGVSALSMGAPAHKKPGFRDVAIAAVSFRRETQDFPGSGGSDETIAGSGGAPNTTTAMVTEDPEVALRAACGVDYEAFKVVMCESTMCTSCSLEYCTKTCQETQVKYPNCKCPAWPSDKGTFSTGDFAGKGRFGNFGNYARGMHHAMELAAASPDCVGALTGEELGMTGEQYYSALVGYEPKTGVDMQHVEAQVFPIVKSMLCATYEWTQSRDLGPLTKLAEDFVAVVNTDRQLLDPEGVGADPPLAAETMVEFFTSGSTSEETAEN